GGQAAPKCRSLPGQIAYHQARRHTKERAPPRYTHAPRPRPASPCLEQSPSFSPDVPAETKTSRPAMPTLQLRMTARCGDHNGEATSRAATKYQRRSSVLLWAQELHTAVSYGDNVPGMILSATFDVPGAQLAKSALGCV